MITKEGRVFYANDITKHTQWEHPMYSIEEQEARDLSNAIKASLNNENAISEVSNNNTANTISMEILNKPAPNNQQYTSTIQLQPIANNYIIPKPQSTPINDSSEISQRKIYDKEHIIWLFTFCLGIYDLVTDYQCAILWRKYSSLCTQFRCPATFFNVKGLADAFSFYLLLCSFVGFIACLVLKLKEFKMLRQIFKHPITKHELEQKEQINWKTFLYLGWISVALEDTVSLYMVLVVWMNSMFVVNIDVYSLYSQSLVSSLLSICITILLSCRKHWKLMKAKIFQCARCCHCCWCTVICLLILFPLYAVGEFIINYSQFSSYGEWPKIDIIYNVVDHDPLCPMYNNNGKLGYYSNHTGELTGFPDLIYENCSGMDYEYNLFCLENGIDHIQLNCTLQWEYKYIIYNTSDSEYMNVSMWVKYDDFNCYNYDEDYCEFDIELGVCGHYPISCKNQFEFYGNNSDPMMWACFDYCEY